jgi:hypothetical protein
LHRNQLKDKEPNMKRFSPRTFSLITAGVLSLASTTFAQTTPPPPPEAGGQEERRGPGGPGGEDRPRPGQRGDAAGGQEGPRGQGQGGPGMGPGGEGRGPGGPGQGGPGGQRQGVPPEVARFQNYLTMVDSYAKLAKDPEASAVAAVVSAADVLRPKGPAGAIEYFNKILPSVKSATVQRAIRLQLMDFYKASNQPEKALEQLQLIMTADTSETKKE